MMSIEKRSLRFLQNISGGARILAISFGLGEICGSWNAHRICMEGRESVMGRRLKFRSTSDNGEELITNDYDGAQLT